MSRVSSTFPTLGEYFGDIPPDIVGGTKAIFTRDNLPLALAGVGATLVAFTLDQSIQNYFEDHRPLGTSDTTGSRIGSPYSLAAGAVGLFLAGEALGDRKLADAGMASAEALAVDAMVTGLLKHAAHRERPNGTDDQSFPSGHASATAAFAASVSEMYDWNLFVAVPLYSVTAFVAASRIQTGEHYFSDVVAGVTLGTIIGKSFAGHMKKKRAGTPSGLQLIGVLPLAEGNCPGITALWRF